MNFNPALPELVSDLDWALLGSPRVRVCHPGVRPWLLGPHLDMLLWVLLAPPEGLDTEAQRPAGGLAEAVTHTRAEKRL